MADIITVPLYEPIIAGSPFYMVLLVVMGGILALGAIALWTEIYVPLRSVWGLRSAIKNHVPLAIITGMNHNIWMESVEYVAGFFKSLELPLLWIITSKTAAGQIGGKANAIFVSDDWNIVHDQDIDYAIAYAAKKWNEKHPDQFIKDWETFESHLVNNDLDLMFPEGIKLPPFRIVDPNEIQRYLPKWAAAHHAGYINQEVAKRENKNPEADKRMMYYIIGAGVLLLALAGLGYVLITSAHCHP